MSSPIHNSELSQSYIDAYNGDRLKGTAIALIVLETVFVALRQWSRHLQKAPFGWDDILIIPAYLSCLGMCIAGILALEHGGVGHHLEVVAQLSPEKLPYWGKTCLIAIPALYAPAVTFPRLVVLAVYLRVFTDKRSRSTSYVLAAVTIVACIVNVILSMWPCDPYAFKWDRTIEGGYCRVDGQLHLRIGGLPNIPTDLAMLILPLPVILRLNTSTRIKLGLTTTFLMGGLGLVFSILRFAQFFIIDAFEDATWNSAQLVMWACIEPAAYLIAACLLACPNFLSALCRKDWQACLRAQDREIRSRAPSFNIITTSSNVGLHSIPKQKRVQYPSVEDDMAALHPSNRADRISAEGQAERGENASPTSTTSS